MRIAVGIAAFAIGACGDNGAEDVIAECEEIEKDHEGVSDLDYKLDLSAESRLKIDAKLLRRGGVLTSICGKNNRCVVRSKKPYAIYVLDEELGVRYFTGVGNVKIEIVDEQIVCSPQSYDEGRKNEQ